jgi:hypothetical protein
VQLLCELLPEMLQVPLELHVLCDVVPPTLQSP